MRALPRRSPAAPDGLNESRTETGTVGAASVLHLQPCYDRLQRESELRALSRRRHRRQRRVRGGVGLARPADPEPAGAPGGGGVPGRNRHRRLPQQPAGAGALLSLPGAAHAHEPHAGQHLGQRPAGQRAGNPVQLRRQHAGPLADRTRRLHLVRLRQRLFR